MAGVFLDFFAQAINDMLEQNLIAAIKSTPNGLDNALRAKNMARTIHEQEYQPEFQVGQSDFQSVWIDDALPPPIQPEPTFI